VKVATLLLESELTLKRGKISNTMLRALASTATRVENSLSLRAALNAVDAATSGKMVTGLGEPNNANALGHRSMGVWIFEHSSGITFLVFSDGLRKHPERGTSYEVINPTGNWDLAATLFKDLLLMMKKMSDRTFMNNLRDTE
jgi:hypothetical protein